MSYLTIDNPSNTKIQIEFDLSKKIIPAKSSTVIGSPGGIHKLKYQNIDTSIYIEEKKNYLINPTMSTYFKEEIVYVTHQKKGSNIKMKNIPFSVLDIEDSIPVFGPYERINTLMIKNYDFNVGQKVPSSLKSKYDTLHRVKLHRYEEFMKKLSKTNQAIHKKNQLSIAEIQESRITPIKIDYIQERNRILRQKTDLLPARSKKSRARMSLMEFNTNGSYTTVIMLADSTAMVLKSEGYLLKNKLTYFDGISKKDEQTMISALSFFSNVWAIVENEKLKETVDEFRLPKDGEILFHSWETEAKYSIALNHDSLIKNHMKVTYTNAFDMLYSQGFKTIELLKTQE